MPCGGAMHHKAGASPIEALRRRVPSLHGIGSTSGREVLGAAAEAADPPLESGAERGGGVRRGPLSMLVVQRGDRIRRQWPQHRLLGNRLRTERGTEAPQDRDQAGRKARGVGRLDRRALLGTGACAREHEGRTLATGVPPSPGMSGTSYAREGRRGPVPARVSGLQCEQRHRLAARFDRPEQSGG